MSYKDMNKRAQAIQRSNERNRREYDRISLLVPKGDRERIINIAEQQGKSVNKLIVDLLYSTYPIIGQHERDSRTDK